LAFGQIRRTQYDAETTVVVYPVAGAAFNQQQTGNLLIDLSTEAQVVRSDDVANLANERLQAMGYDKLTVAGLISRVSAAVETNAQVLRITYSAGSPVRARDGADAFAAAYLSYRESQAKTSAQTQLKGVDAQRTIAQRALNLNRSKLSSSTPGSSAYAQAQAGIDSADKQLVDLSTQAADIAKRPVLPGEVLSPATLPSAPHGISSPILGGLGLLLGLLLGTIAAVIRERMVGTIRRADALPAEPPVLAVAPATRLSEPVLLSRPDHRAGEPYRLLALTVDAAVPAGTPLHSLGRLVVVSSLTNPAPPVAINLALAIAETGRLCTYVEAVPRHNAPLLPALGVNANAPGFADAVMTGADPMPMRLHPAPRLSMLAAGSDIGRAAESYGGPRTHRVLEALRRAADVVVVAAPPLTDPDGQALAIEADTVVIGVAVGDATFGALADSVAEAQRVRASVLGVVAFHPTNIRSSSARPNKNSNVRVTAPSAHDSVAT
jgi:capsular polysaccharide biosynthesis protein/Mrp family chromosome partitioning ATPase